MLRYAESIVIDISCTGKSSVEYWFRMYDARLLFIPNSLKAIASINVLWFRCPSIIGYFLLHHLTNISTNYGPLTTVVERLKPESIYKKFVKFRNSLGIEVIPTSGETDIFMKLLRRAKEGRMIALVADRDITKNGIEVNYGPGKASFPVGPAAIAVALDGLVLPLSSHYNQEDVLVMHFFPALSPSGEDTKEKRVQTMTQELAHSFEKEIKKHPQDWHMLQRVWTDVFPMKRINQGLVN